MYGAVSTVQGQDDSSEAAAAETTETTGNLHHLVLCETRADSDHWYSDYVTVYTGPVWQEGDSVFAERATI